MKIDATMIRRIANLNVPVEAMREMFLVLAEQWEQAEVGLSKDRARKFHGKSKEVPGNIHGNSVETPVSRVEDNTLPSLTSGKEVKEENKTPHNPPTSSKPLPSDEPEGFRGWAEFREIYPKRDGSADWKGAMKAYRAALRRASPFAILEGVTLFAAAMIERGKVGTEFIPQARTWLNGDRWNERYSEPPPKPNSFADGFSKVRAVVAELRRREDGGSNTDGGENPEVISRLRESSG